MEFGMFLGVPTRVVRANEQLFKIAPLADGLSQPPYTHVVHRFGIMNAIRIMPGLTQLFHSKPTKLSKLIIPPLNRAGPHPLTPFRIELGLSFYRHRNSSGVCLERFSLFYSSLPHLSPYSGFRVTNGFLHGNLLLCAICSAF